MLATNGALAAKAVTVEWAAHIHGVPLMNFLKSCAGQTIPTVRRPDSPGIISTQ